MELYIRSQDNYTLSKYNNKITIIDGTGMKKALDESLFSAFAAMEQMQLLKDGWCLSVDDLILGIYPTKERALEILDDIQNFMIAGGATIEEQEEVGIKLESWCAINKITNTGVYQMPKE